MIKKVLVLLVGLSLWFISPPWGITVQAWQLFATFFSAILAVLLNAFPILLAALIALVIVVMTGTLAVENAFSGFSGNLLRAVSSMWR